MNYCDLESIAMNSVPDRVLDRMKALGLSQADLMRATEASKGTVSKWLAGTNLPSGKYISDLAKALQTTPEWLLKGGDTQKSAPVSSRQQMTKGGYRVRYVPIKGSAKMGNDGYFNHTDSFCTEDGDGYVPSMSGSPNSYALRGTGGSMHPVIRDGWYVVCDPDTNAVAGEFVLVCINNERCIIKEYITERDGLLHLLSVNSGERLTLELSEVTAIVPIIEILPPSRRVIEVPIFDV